MAIDHEHDIVKVRNGYIAHIQEKGQFKTTMNEMFAGSKTPTDFAAWHLLLKNIEKYAISIVANFEEAFEAAGKKYNAQPDSETILSEINMNDVDEESRRIYFKVAEKLKRAGFRATMSNDVIQRMKS